MKKYRFKLSSHEQKVIERLRAETNDGETSIDSEEHDEPYWMDHEDDDNERDGVLVFDKVSPGEMEEEAKAMKEHLKLTKKRQLQTPMKQLPERTLCTYEKIRESIIRERMEAMENSGLFENFDELKRKVFQEKLCE